MFELPRYQEIPDVGLYLEQVVKYINRYTLPITHTTLTGSMISNYVKKGIIDNPKKKLYYRDQIAFCIYIAIAKSVISLEDIQILFDIIDEKYENKNAYEYLCIEFENAIDYVFGNKETLDPVDDSFSTGRVLLRDTVLAIAHKIYLDYRFEQLHQERKPGK